MALHPCPECKKEVSDRALSCPHCGTPQRAWTNAIDARRRMLQRTTGLVLLVALVGGGLALARRKPDDYTRVEQLRAEQDADGTHDQNVRQRFYRLYKAHPDSAMYIYLWSRCVDDPAEQLRLAQEGIRTDPSFSWNYNMAARALARQDHLSEAYDVAMKGAALDPGNMQLADKQRSLRAMIDHKLGDEPRPTPGADKSAGRYEGLFHSALKSPDRADLEAIASSRLPDNKGQVADLVRGFVVCANPFADACVRTYVPRDARIKTWPPVATDVTTIKEHALVAVTGTVVANGKGESVILADGVTVEAP